MQLIILVLLSTSRVVLLVRQVQTSLLPIVAAIIHLPTLVSMIMQGLFLKAVVNIITTVETHH